jgi:hypothetical protein
MRYRAIKNNPWKARLLVVSNMPCMVLVNLLILVPGGIFVYIFFYGCNPMYTRKVINKNQIGPYWVYLVLSESMPAFCGIMFASIIAYSVVQHSLGIALLSKTIVSEILTPLFFVKRQINTDIKVKLIQVLTVFFGLLSILYSVSFAYVKNTMIALFFLFNNSINSPILGLFFLSAFNPYANGVGAMLGFVSNLGFNFFMGLGSLVISRLKPQEFPPDTSMCQQDYHRNMSTLNVYDMTHPMHHSTNMTHPTTTDYYPKNPTLFYLYSIAPIWYCLFSVLYTFTSGSLFSFAYSYIKTRSIDADVEFKKERRQYLYIYRMFRKESILSSTDK